MFNSRRVLKSINILFHNRDKWSTSLLKAVEDGCTIETDFVTDKEEVILLAEVEPHMKRLRYEKAHWDDAIYLYREREQRNWSPENVLVIERMQNASFFSNLIRSDYVHILDLHQNGHIRPHIDSKRYCGEVVSGISLLSDCVMRLRHQDRKDELIVDLYLKRRSLYKLSGPGRHEFTHEILNAETSFFNDQKVERSRRISIICRDMPQINANHEDIFKFKSENFEVK